MYTQRRIEFTFSLTYANGSTEALTITAWSCKEAEEAIAKRYLGAALNWII